MKRLAVLGVILVALAGLAWGVAAMVTQTAAQRWLEARAAEGWLAHVERIDVSGFPIRFVTEFRDVDLADPQTGLAWSAPWFRFEQDVMRLDRLRAVFPSEQTLASPVERLSLQSSTLEAQLDVQPTQRFALDALNGDLSAFTVTSTQGWQTGIDAATLRITRVNGTAATYDLAFSAEDLTPTEGLRALLDPATVLPERMAEVGLQAQTQFDAPWSLDSIEQQRPQVTRLDIDEISARWGGMLFRASGLLEVSETGVPEGELAVRAENWTAMLELASNAGLVPERLRSTAQAMLEVLAGLSGRPENIDATLSFANGRVFLGPLPLGAAPNLRIR